jgi:tRNA (cmo5U34)-methyltransferase
MPTWHEHDKVDEYVGRVNTLPQRRAGEEALVEVLPESPRRALDLGCGDGVLAALLLAARPSIERVLAVDASPPMLELARTRFAEEPRVEVRSFDLNDSIAGFGAFDVIVSGFAIHHLEDARKRSLLDEAASQLTPGGCFANLEVVASPTPELHAEFRAAIGRQADDPEDQLVAVEPQLEWMRAAGLEQVDCMWKWRGFALLVGRAPTPS